MFHKVDTNLFELFTNLFCLINMNEIIHIFYSDLQGESFALEAYSKKEAKDLIKVHFEEFKKMPYLVKADNFLTYRSVINYSVALAQGVNHG